MRGCWGCRSWRFWRVLSQPHPLPLSRCASAQQRQRQQQDGLAAPQRVIAEKPAAWAAAPHLHGDGLWELEFHARTGPFGAFFAEQLIQRLFKKIFFNCNIFPFDIFGWCCKYFFLKIEHVYFAGNIVWGNISYSVSMKLLLFLFLSCLQPTDTLMLFRKSSLMNLVTRSSFYLGLPQINHKIWMSFVFCFSSSGNNIKSSFDPEVSFVFLYKNDRLHFLFYIVFTAPQV